MINWPAEQIPKLWPNKERMSIMSIFDKFLGKEKNAAPVCEPLTIYAPAAGAVIALEQFPDELFSQEVLGPGCGILPAEDQVAAPFNGTVTQLTDTRHAIGVTSSDGVELLIHVGVDTVEMEGKGFQSAVKEGQKISRGDVLIKFDRKAIREAGHPDAIAVIVTNSDEFAKVELKAEGDVDAGAVILKAEK